MEEENYTIYTEMKDFLKLDEQDIAHMRALRPVFEKHGPAITDAFYETLGDYPKTAKIIEGRVDALKKTHIAWTLGLFESDYGRAFFDQQYTIGQVHVVQDINPEFVEGVMNSLRLDGRKAIETELGAGADAMAHHDSLVKVLDLALMTINLAYQDERLARISGFTGMSRKLLENLVKRGGKKKKKA